MPQLKVLTGPAEGQAFALNDKSLIIGRDPKCDIKLDEGVRELGGLYRFLSDPYPAGPNWYLERIEANMEKIRNPKAEIRR